MNFLAAADSAAVLNLAGGAFAGLLVAAAGAFFIRRKTKAETTDLITQAAERIVKQVSARNDDLERSVSALWRAIHALAAMVRNHGGDPSEVLLDIERAALIPGPRAQNGDQ